jgi:hypothetical protein
MLLIRQVGRDGRVHETERVAVVCNRPEDRYTGCDRLPGGEGMKNPPGTGIAGTTGVGDGAASRAPPLLAFASTFIALKYRDPETPLHSRFTRADYLH